MRALYIDEDGAPATARVLLAGLGIELEEASDGLDGLRRGRARRPSVIFANARLARMDGLSLCAALKADPSLREVPVILLGRTDDLMLRHRALMLGAAFIASPPPVEELWRALRRALERAEWPPRARVA